MDDEHRDVDDQLLHMALLADAFAPPDDACGSWRRLCRPCREFADDLREHMRLENHVLFPPFTGPG